MTNKTIEDEVQSFYTRVEKALDKACSNIKVWPDYKVSWWTPELTLAKRKSTILLHKAFNISLEYWAEHKSVSKSFKSLSNKSKETNGKLLSQMSTLHQAWQNLPKPSTELKTLKPFVF